MHPAKKISTKLACIAFCSLLAISYSHAGYSDSTQYQTKGYEYKLQKTGKGVIDDATIDEIAADLANNKKPIYSLIVDNDSLAQNALEKLLNALKTNNTIQDLSFLNFSGENITKISKTLETDLLTYRQSKQIRWIDSVAFTNTHEDTTTPLEKSVVESISKLIISGLARLNLRGNNIGDKGMVTIAKELPGSILTHLNLSNCKIEDGGIAALANALRKGNDRLTHLNLDKNNFAASSVIEIITAANLYNLSNLSLAENNIGDNEDILGGIFTHYARHGSNRIIYNINLAKNNISSKGAIKIAETALAYSRYFTLNLAYNNIDFAGAEAIARSKAWSESSETIINLKGNNIGLNGLMALVKTAPTEQKLAGLDLEMMFIAANHAAPTEVTKGHEEL